MRTISADDNAILTGGAKRILHRIQVKDSGGTFRDLSTYPGVNLISELTWGEDLDNPGIEWDATLTREEGSISLAPFMQASPLNRGFNPAASYAALLQVGRQMKVEYLMQAEDDPRTGTWVLAFSGYIGTVDSGGTDSVKIGGSGLEALLINTYIQRERVYAFAQGANADRGCYIYTPSTAWAVGDRVIPTDSKVNDHFYRCTTAGTSAATEPTWPTGGGSTVTSGGAVFTESGATSTSTGTDVETIMQQILDDNLGAGVVTLSCPVSPGWGVRWFLVGRQPVFDELKGLADQIGWCLRYMYDSGSGAMKLKLFDPDRANTTSMRSFGGAEVDGYSRLKTDWKDIRNTIRVVYSDSQDLDAAGNPKRKSVTSTSSSSQTKYGVLFSEVAESSVSNIDSSTEAQALTDAILSDLAEPTAEMEAALLSFFAFIEVADLYTLTADGVHFDADQKLAVVSFSHSISAQEQSTTFRLRGAPSSNGASGWASLMTDAQGAEVHALTVKENVSAPAVTADTKPVGGTRLSFTWDGAKSQKDTHFELHLSKSAAFTASSATLVATGKERSFEVGNLDPGVTYHAQLIPITWNAQKPVRGNPSAEVSFVAGRAQATHLNSDVQWGRLPLNGGFETQFNLIAPPDFWTARDLSDGSDAWGVGVTLGTSGGLEGANYVKLKTLSSTDVPLIVSARFGVNELEWNGISFWRKAVSGGANVFILGIQYFDAAGTFTGAYSENFFLNDQVGSWVLESIAAQLPPSGSRYAQLTININGGSSGQELHIDSVLFGAEDRWHVVGGSGEPAFAGLWAAFGSPYPPPRFKRTRDGWVALSGLVAGGATPSTIFTLPTGYRPKSNENVLTIVYASGGVGSIEVQSGGNVVLLSGTTTYVQLEGIRFKVD